MFNIERWQEIFQAIGQNKLRTFLTGTSVASGIFILVILLGAGKGLENGIKKQFERDAAGIIQVWSGTTTKEYKGLNPGREIQFHNSDYELSVAKFGDQMQKKKAPLIISGAGLWCTEKKREIINFAAFIPIINLSKMLQWLQADL